MHQRHKPVPCTASCMHKLAKRTDLLTVPAYLSETNSLRSASPVFRNVHNTRTSPPRRGPRYAPLHNLSLATSNAHTSYLHIGSPFETRNGTSDITTRTVLQKYGGQRAQHALGRSSKAGRGCRMQCGRLRWPRMLDSIPRHMSLCYTEKACPCVLL